MSDICVVCSDPVRPRQQGILCDECEEWTHRKCGTGVTLQRYREAVKNNLDIPFKCQRCLYRPETDHLIVQDDHEPIDEEPNDQETNDHGVSFHIQTSFFSDVSTLETTHRMDTSEQPPHHNVSVNGDLIQPFHIADVSINAQEEVTETPLPAEELSTSIVETNTQTPVTYTVFPEGSKKGKPLLVSTDGYRYSMKKRNPRTNTVSWICSSRSTKVRCYVSVVQTGEHFQRMKPHEHAPDVSLMERVSAQVETKQKSRDNPFMSARAIGQKVRQATIDAKKPNVPSVANLARAANRYRSKLRPAEPSDLSFVVDKEFLRSDDFLVADITNGTSRHLLFATPEQLEILGKTKRWFMDGTFKVVGKPFESGQLASVHGFVNTGDIEKQLPLAFILMSRRRREDYVKVLSSLRDALPQVAVESVVMDFEQAAWLAVREVFPGVSIQGCVFHFVQAVWRKIQDLGLKPAYTQRASVYQYLRLIMGLPFLPANHIEPSFVQIAARANSQPLRDLVNYIENQWLNHPIFDVESWSVFNLTVRTNNDVEGWHHRLNRAAGYQPLTFYRLVPVLRNEAENISYELRHLRDGLVTRRIRPAVKGVEKRIQALWDN